MQGHVSIRTTDRPTGRRTILPCYLSIAEWFDARSKSLSEGAINFQSHIKGQTFRDKVKWPVLEVEVGRGRIC